MRKSFGLLIFLSLILIFITLGCSTRPSPELALKKMSENIQNKNWNAVYDAFDSQTKAHLNVALKMLISFASLFSEEDLSNFSGKELFIRMAEQQEYTNTILLKEYQVLKTTIEKDKAILDIKSSAKYYQEVTLVWENNEWKFRYIEDEKPAGENLLKEELSPKIKANDALAKSTLKTVSTAAETYATVNKGIYPKNIKDLLNASPAYLNKNYCDKEINGFKYICKFSNMDYEIIAKPVQLRITGSTVFKIATGGILSSLAEESKLSEEEKENRKKQKELATLARQAKQDELKELKETLTVALVEKDFKKIDYQDYITLKIAIQNEREKDIRAFKGTLRFKDVFGDTIMNVGFKHDEKLKAKDKTIWNGSVKYNMFKDSDKKFKNTDLKNIVLEWLPEQIIFDDKTKIGKE